MHAADGFSLFFVCLLAITVLTRFWLGMRQIGHVTAHRDTVPVAFANTIALSAHQKAADYTVAKTRLVLAEGATQAVLLLLLTLGGVLQGIDTFWRSILPESELLRGTVVIVCALAISGLADIPFSYYKIFGVDARFGFTRMSRAMFFADLVKHTLIGAGFGIPLILAALWLMQHAGEWWWLYLWLVWSGFNVLMLAIYPTFIAPLFNRFTPLQDATLKSRVEGLLAKCGFQSQGLFVMDGSSRSSHGNAYFTGFGAAKRVVLFDTLLERLNGDEIEAVLAHELGHFRHRHVMKRIGLLFAVSFFGLALLGWLADQPWFYDGLGVVTPSDYMALLLFLLVSPVLTFLLRPLLAVYARSNEFEADAYAARHASAKHLVDALVKLYRDNASTLTPDPLHSAFYDTHPPASVRIERLGSSTKEKSGLPYLLHSQTVRGGRV
jgi:STE24 endopeptidase